MADTVADTDAGPSKNELKKQAKKAEKAAKKQASSTAAPPAGGDKTPAPQPVPTNQQKGKAEVGASSESPQPPPSPRKVLLYNGAEDDAATLKVVYAAQHYGVEVGVAKHKDLPKGCQPSSSKGSKTKKPILIYGSDDYVLGGGGNAMCKAIALMGGSPLSFEADEWCEIERTTLRNDSSGGLPLDALAAGLEASSTGVHLVGDSDSMADICVVVALSKYAADAELFAKWPLIVQKYYKCHVPALERARVALPDYLPAPPVDMKDPSLLTVLTGIFTKAVEAIAPEVELPSSIVKKCDRPKDGDYQCSVAMPAFASLKKLGALPDGITSPPQLAQAIVDHLGTGHPVVAEMRLQGPGFIMCRVTKSYLEGQLKDVITTKSLPKPKIGQEKTTCLVDFSSPNIASTCPFVLSMCSGTHLFVPFSVLVVVVVVSGNIKSNHVAPTQPTVVLCFGTKPSSRLSISTYPLNDALLLLLSHYRGNACGSPP
jgi:hypothetical protein